MYVPEPTVDSKKCARCGETKPAREFSRNRYVRTGLASNCKPCAADYAREYRGSKEPPEIRERRLRANRKRDKLDRLELEYYRKRYPHPTREQLLGAAE